MNARRPKVGSGVNSRVAPQQITTQASVAGTATAAPATARASQTAAEPLPNAAPALTTTCTPSSARRIVPGSHSIGTVLRRRLATGASPSSVVEAVTVSMSLHCGGGACLSGKPRRPLAKAARPAPPTIRVIP